MRFLRVNKLHIVVLAALVSVLVLFCFIGIYSQSQAKNNKDILSGSETWAVPTMTPPKRELEVLSECAKTACVAIKAAEYKAQAEAERQAELVAEAEAQAAANQVATAGQSCEEMLAKWEARYAGVPSSGRTGMPCGPYTGYSSAWTAGQAEWAAMSESEKIREAQTNGGTYGQP